MSAPLDDRSPHILLREIFKGALEGALGEEGTAPPLKPRFFGPAIKPEHGDYSISAIMPIAQALKQPAAGLAEKIQSRFMDQCSIWLDEPRPDQPPYRALGVLADTVKLAGPGFLNIKLADAFVLAYLENPAFFPKLLTGWQQEEHEGSHPRVIIDMSSPNLAKEMHIGHLRSTIIGDAVARIRIHRGDEVIRQNHVGDWGTQFGMLLAHMRSLDQRQQSEQLFDLEKFYQIARRRFDDDPDFAAEARQCVVRLQAGDDPALMKDWAAFRETSLQHCFVIYELLGVDLKPGDVRGESAYKDALESVIQALTDQGLIKHSDGALCVFMDEGDITGEGDQLPPLIVQKSDQAYLYATTDLAALRERKQRLDVNRNEALQPIQMLYFVDARQSLHFKQVFKVAAKAGFMDEADAQHLAFGVIKGRDGKPLKTRDGGVVKLMDLLQEAQKRAVIMLEGRQDDLLQSERAKIVQAVAIGAIKYADLSKDRTKDYVFDWDEMLNLQGNTAPYLQYAYARVRSLFARAEQDFSQVLAFQQDSKVLEDMRARGLALHLLEFSQTLARVIETSKPHILCHYLYQLATKFSLFYEHCPILQAEAGLRQDRLRLAQLSANTLETGLSLLGISVVERM